MIYRNEYPRPQFMRGRWQNLNGLWNFCFDDEKKGEQCGYITSIPCDMKINVPFAYQSAESGLEIKEMHEVMWYQKEFALDQTFKNRVLLCFNAVDYEALVWLNGNFVGTHKGGYTEFHFDVTDFLRDKNILTVKVIDRYDAAQLRGKQCWYALPDRCWYRGTSGIWQSVWLEEVGAGYIDYALIAPDIDHSSANIQLKTVGNADKVKISLFYKGALVKEQTETLTGVRTHVEVAVKEYDSIDEVHYWRPESPNLYDVHFELFNGGKVVDTVKTYFGMRKVSVDGNRILLNNSLIYQKLILDQGYWEKSDLTPPSAESLKEDILSCKAMGFNGARKHQKIEESYYYYYADKLGFLVWGETPSAYEFCTDEIENYLMQCTETVKKLYNHPSVIAYVPFNESWGVRNLLYDARQKAFVKGAYYLLKSLDKTRLVCANDGWEAVEETDFIGVHDYSSDGGGFPNKYNVDNLDIVFPMARRLFGFGEKYRNTPMIMTEFGGIALKIISANSSSDNEPCDQWAYVTDDSEEAFLTRFNSLIKGIKECNFAGYCYTQLTDVQQEVNGLLDKNHKPKFAFEVIKKTNE